MERGQPDFHGCKVQVSLRVRRVETMPVVGVMCDAEGHPVSTAEAASCPGVPLVFLLFLLPFCSGCILPSFLFPPAQPRLGCSSISLLACLFSSSSPRSPGLHGVYLPAS